MKTDIEFLTQLEADLEDVATREAARLERLKMRGSIRRNTGRTWARVVGIAAVVVLVAGSIGLLTQAGSVKENASAGSADRGDVLPAGPGASPAPSLDEGSDREGLGFAPGEPPGERGGDERQSDLSKIVRDGRIGIVVADGGFDDAVGDLTFIAEEHGGFILSSSTQNERSGTFVLRIPADRFDRAIANVRDLAFRKKIRFQQITGDDVTAEYVDYQARLRILQDRKARLQSLEDDADTTAEILALGRQIDEVQLRIEQIQGQLRFLDDQIAESTLRVSIQERSAPAVVPPVEIENPDVGSAFALAYQGVLRIVTAVVVGLGYLVPLVVLGALVWFAVVLIRRRRAIA